MYKVSWSKRARESLKKIDAVIAQKIVDKVENYLVKDPVNLGEPLLYAYFLKIVEPLNLKNRYYENLSNW